MLDSFNPGPVTWKPIAISGSDPDAGLAAISQNSPVSDVRLGSGGVMNANRVGDLTKVRVDGYASRWAYTLDDYVGWAGAHGQIQWRTPGTTTWNALKDIVTGSRGDYEYTYTIAAKREYRTYFPSVVNIFGSSSNIQAA